MRLAFGAKLVGAGFIAVAPSYLIERITEYYFLASNPVFFAWSGNRADLFIVSILFGAIASGLLVEELLPAIIAYIAGITVLLLLVFFVCDPKVCYSAGIDGLEPVRDEFFFACLGIVGVVIGGSKGRAPSKGPGRESLIRNVGLPVAMMVAISYYPLMFAFAGAKLLSPLSPYPTLIVVALTSVVAGGRISRCFRRRLAVGAPVMAMGVLALLALGIARQYLVNVIPLAIVILIIAASGAYLGTLRLHRGTVGLERVAGSNYLMWTSVLLVILMLVILVPDATANVFPKGVSGGGVSVAPAYGTLVYAGGFMPGPFFRPEGVATTVTFAGTDLSSIQPDNFLSAGIGGHSPHCCVDGIDFGYRLDAYLYHDGSEMLAAEAWEICDWNMACGGHPWQDLIFFDAQRVSFPLQSDLRLVMEWENRTVVWSYSVGQGPSVELTSFNPPTQENGYFHSGVFGVVPSSPQPPGVLTPTAAGFYFFQFGMSSHFPIGHPGWEATFLCPSYSINGTSWTCLPHADSVQGDQSYWKVFWRWGEAYPNVTTAACAEVAEPHCATFVYDPSHTLPSFEPLW